LLCFGLLTPIAHYFIWEHFIAQPRLHQARENCLTAENAASDARHRLELAKLSAQSGAASKSQAINIAQSIENLLASARKDHDRRIGEAAAAAMKRATDAEEATRRAKEAEMAAKKIALNAENASPAKDQSERNPSIPQAVVNELHQFIDAYVAAQSSNDINTHKSLYGDRVNYSYKKGISTRQEVLMDMEKNIRRWPNRQYQIVPGGTTTSQKSANEFQLKFSLTYQYTSSNNRASGKTDITVSVVKQDGAWRVIEWTERVTK
jgi:hypothetical protein